MRGKRWLLGIIAFLCLAYPVPANAARFSGEYLLHVCGSDEEGSELVEGGHIACQAYIAGVLDYHNLIRSLGTSPSVEFCVPEGVSMNELQGLVYNYLYQNKAEHSKFIASPVVALALLSSFPCN